LHPSRSAATAEKAAPITIVINQSPWLDSFRGTVELYEKETGNKVELDAVAAGARCAKAPITTIKPLK
jgi:multiple sugar transport system substrate-binding protein